MRPARSTAVTVVDTVVVARRLRELRPEKKSFFCPCAHCGWHCMATSPCCVLLCRLVDCEDRARRLFMGHQHVDTDRAACSLVEISVQLEEHIPRSIYFREEGGISVLLVCILHAFFIYLLICFVTLPRVIMCVVFALNRSFYPTTSSSVHPESLLILHPSILEGYKLCGHIL